jgi:hypothetical protein
VVRPVKAKPSGWPRRAASLDRPCAAAAARFGGRTFEILPPIEVQRMGATYGFDKVRFMAPVKSGARIPPISPLRT